MGKTERRGTCLCFLDSLLLRSLFLPCLSLPSSFSRATHKDACSSPKSACSANIYPRTGILASVDARRTSLNLCRLSSMEQLMFFFVKASEAAPKIDTSLAPAATYQPCQKELLDTTLFSVQKSLALVPRARLMTCLLFTLLDFCPAFIAL